MWTVIENMKPDGCAAMLFALEYPSLVVVSRRDISGLARCANSERFPLREISRAIDDNQRLALWCRDTLGLPPSEAVPDCIIASCIQLLSNACGALSGHTRPESRKLAIEVCLRGDVSDEGFGVVYDTIASVLNTRPGLSTASVVAASQLVVYIVFAAKGENFAAGFILKCLGRRQPAESQFRKSLMRCTRDLGTPVTCQVMTSVGVQTTNQELDLALNAHHSQSSTIAKSRLAVDSKNCENPTCASLGVKNCSRCGLARYCGRDCQTADWKAHKRVCKGKPAKQQEHRAEVRAALSAVSSPSSHARKSPALQRMEEFLAANPEYDYKLTSDPKQDFGVTFSMDLARVSFLCQRTVAADPDEPLEKRKVALAYMHSTMKDLATQFNITEAQIRKQLVNEYGIKF